MTEKFGHEIKLGKLSCEGKPECENPEDLYGTSTRTMTEQEDGTCPVKVIDGKAYDFRCYFCKKLPRVGSANRYFKSIIISIYPISCIFPQDLSYIDIMLYFTIQMK